MYARKYKLGNIDSSWVEKIHIISVGPVTVPTFNRANRIKIDKIKIGFNRIRLGAVIVEHISES